MAVWRETLAEATAMGSEHLSSYEVIYEEDTPLYAQLKAGEFDVDEELACAMYEELIACATGSGFHQYEIANFARNTASTPASESSGNIRPPLLGERAGVRANLPSTSITSQIPSHACRHNINYWRGGSFYGLGPSATSYVRGVRTKNWSNTQFYCEQLEQGRRAIESREELPPRSRAGEIAAFGLRMNAGWPFDQFQQVTGWDLRREWSVEMNRLVARGWGQSDQNRFQLTRDGLRFADSAAELFLR
jgi:oxygen-independent coproporphyrinogen-3 oxidase